MSNVKSNITKKLISSTTLCVALALSSASASAATEVPEGTSHYSGPNAGSMALDATIGRPVHGLIAVGGAALWLATLPFSILGDNYEEATNKLLIEPTNSFFTRCLGCTPKQDVTNRVLKGKTIRPDVYTDENYGYFNDDGYDNYNYQQPSTRLVVHPYQP